MAMFAVWALYELVELPGCLDLIPGLREFDEIAGAGQASNQGDTLGIPYVADGEAGGVKERLGYDVDRYMCPSVTKYSVAELLAHHYHFLWYMLSFDIF